MLFGHHLQLLRQQLLLVQKCHMHSELPSWHHRRHQLVPELLARVRDMLGPGQQLHLLLSFLALLPKLVLDGLPTPHVSLQQDLHLLHIPMRHLRQLP